MTTPANEQPHWEKVTLSRWGDDDYYDVWPLAQRAGWDRPLYVSHRARDTICQGLWEAEYGGEEALLLNLITHALSARQDADNAPPDHKHGWHEHQRREDQPTTPGRREAVEFEHWHTAVGNIRRWMRLVREDMDGHGDFVYILETASQADHQKQMPTEIGAVNRMRGHLTEQWGGGTFYYDPDRLDRGDSVFPVWVSRAVLDLIMNGHTGQDEADDRWRVFLLAADRAIFRIDNCGCSAYEEDPESRWKEADYHSPVPHPEYPDAPEHTQWKSWFEHKWRNGGVISSRRLRVYATDMDGRGSIEYAVDLL